MKSLFKIAKEAKKNIETSKSKLSKQYKNTKECQAFYAGDIMNYKDNIQFVDPSGRKKRAMVQFNKVKPVVNATVGFMAQNRRKANVTAKVESNLIRRQFSEYANALKDYIRENNHADQIETQQDKDMVTVGYGAVETAVTYNDGYATTDPNGEVQCGRLDPLKVGWDHTAKAPNLIDKRYCWYEEEYDLDEALALFSNADKEDFEQIDDDENSVENYEYFPRGGAYDKIAEAVDWTNKDDNMVRVYFYQWYDVEPFYRARNPVFEMNEMARDLAMLEMQRIADEYNDEFGLFEFDPMAETLVFNKEIKNRLDDLFEEFIEIVEAPRKVFYTAVLSGNKVFTAYPSISQQDMSIQFKTGDYDAKNFIWTGLVNSLKEPSLYYNKALTELLFVIASNSKGGVMMEENSVENIREFEKKYAKTDAVCIVKEGVISGGKIKDKKTPMQPTGYDQIIAMADQSHADVTGIDKAFMGSSENRDESGVMFQRRIRQVVSTLACYFDSITLFQKMNTRLLLDLMRVYAENNEGGLFKMLGEDGAEDFIRLTKDKLMAEYEVTIVEAPQTPDEKSEQARFLFDLGTQLLQIGDPQGKVIIALGAKYSRLDTKDIQKLNEILLPKDDSIDPAYVQQLEQELNIYKSDFSKAELEKKYAEIAELGAKTEKMAKEITHKQAETAKTLEEAAQRGLENDLMRDNNIEDVSVTI